MRFVVSGNGIHRPFNRPGTQPGPVAKKSNGGPKARHLGRFAAIGFIGIFVSGCSTDFSRFSPDDYVATIPASTNTNNDYVQQSAVQQPAYQAYPAGVDPVNTASISRTPQRSFQPSRPSAVRRPPPPGSRLGAIPKPGRQAATYAERDRQINPYPTSGASPVPIAPGAPHRQTATNYNTYNTYNTYQTGNERSQPTGRQVERYRSAARDTQNLPPNVDRVTTAAIKPARQAQNSSPTYPTTYSTGQPSAQSGDTMTITVLEGDTLTKLSKRYGIAARDLRAANNITNADQLRAGSRLYIPALSKTAVTGTPKSNSGPINLATRYEPTSRAQSRKSDLAVPTKAPNSFRVQKADETYSYRNTRVAPVVSDGSATQYTVAGGDTLGSIAVKTNVRMSDIIRANGMKNSNLQIGQKLIIPGNSSYRPADTQSAAIITSRRGDQLAQKKLQKPQLGPVLPAKKSIAKTDRIVTGSIPKPYTKPRNSGEIIAAAVEEKAPARSGIETFRWPAIGKVISKFGDKRRGETNAGIDISVPEGTSVKAAENGLVIYSGSELQDFGNLVLIRHDGGWVSAYANNKSLSVKRGDKVRRGQVVAKSGRTGNASRPMLHFELRKDSKPVNPQKYLR